MNYGLDLMLYKPSGYRSVLQIILPVDDTLLEEYVQAEDDGTDTRQIEQEILDSVDDTVQEIYAAYENGESFESLVPIYTSDEDMLEHLEDGYSIHSDSILYPEKMVEAAFGEQMQAPGDISEAFVTEYGVHILYYLSDVESGPVELDDAVKEEVYDAVFQQKVEENYNSLVDGLVEDAEL
jgi:parvulin-like peptidyl-prolyl isomerase